MVLTDKLPKRKVEKTRTKRRLNPNKKRGEEDDQLTDLFDGRKEL